MARRRTGARAKDRKARTRDTSRGSSKPGTRQDDASARTAGERDGASADEPQALALTHWFDPGDDGEPYSASIRLSGRRVGVGGAPKPSDTFLREELVNQVVPGSGPVSISTWVYGLKQGEWAVSAELIRPPAFAAGLRGYTSRRSRPEPLPPAAWSWRRWAVSTGPTAPVRTRWALIAPLAKIPAVIPGSFTVLGTLGILVALVVQSAILARDNIPVGTSLAVSLLALLAGLIGAKLWSRALHPGEPLVGPGWAVDGFLVMAPIVAVAALVAFNVPIGLFLDATAPGIFLAVAIGRVGCFFTGCCAGRCTRSRWGLWSSDRRLGARRIPSQLLESAAGLLIGVAAGVLVLSDVVPVQGVTFVTAVATYFLVRQFLLRLRAEPREYLWRRSSPIVPQSS